MATIRKHRNKWQAQVRRQGVGGLSKSFETKAQAIKWAREKEAELDQQSGPANYDSLRHLRLADLLDRYEQEVCPRKRGWKLELYRTRVIKRHPISSLRLSDLSAAAVARYRDERLRTVKADTVRRELTVLRHCLEVARRDWSLPINPNPATVIYYPPPGRGRERRLSKPEEEALFASAKKGPWYLVPIITLALETAMRQGELLSFKWSDLNEDLSLLRLPITKNGKPRVVPISPRAQAVLAELPRTDERVFPISRDAIRLSWVRLREKIGLQDLRFHDLRHEAISRLFERGFSIPEVALVSGHSDPRMLFRYTHLKAEDVLAKMQAHTKETRVAA